MRRMHQCPRGWGGVHHQAPHCIALACFASQPRSGATVGAARRLRVRVVFVLLFDTHTHTHRVCVTPRPQRDGHGQCDIDHGHHAGALVFVLS
jgi:hypothetical protein